MYNIDINNVPISTTYETKKENDYNKSKLLVHIHVDAKQVIPLLKSGSNHGSTLIANNLYKRWHKPHMMRTL